MDENNKKRLKYAAVVGVVFAVLVVTLLTQKGVLSHKEPESVTYRRVLMGTIVELTLWDNGQDLDRAAEAGFAEIKRLVPIFSSYDPASDVSKISRNAGMAVPVKPETLEVVKTAVDIASRSHGAFDPTIGALARLWGPSGERGVVPSEKEIKKPLSLVNWTKIVADDKTHTIMLKDKGMSINLGGVAKGYIAGKAAESLKVHGITRAIIKAGGDMFVYQPETGQPRPFVIGIQDPREKKVLAQAYIETGAVSTSGDYERYFVKDGIRYHHILDPKTGMPARKSRSVTIIAKDPTLSDALSTAVFVMGPKDGMALIEELPDVEGLIVDADGKVFLSTGFKGKVFP